MLVFCPPGQPVPDTSVAPALPQVGCALDSARACFWTLCASSASLVLTALFQVWLCYAWALSFLQVQHGSITDSVDMSLDKLRPGAGGDRGAWLAAVHGVMGVRHD